MLENIDIIHDFLYENEMILVTKFQNYHKFTFFGKLPQFFLFIIEYLSYSKLLKVKYP